MCDRQSRDLRHGWDSAIHGVTSVVKHKQLHNYFALIRLQYSCRMHHNTHQTDSRCRVEPIHVQWWETSSKWEMSLHIAGSIWTYHLFLTAWSLTWRSWRSLGWISDNILPIWGSYGFVLSILETFNQVPLEPCLGQLQYPQRRWHVSEIEPPSVRMHTYWI
jgi:hypothetical protein